MSLDEYKDKVVNASDLEHQRLVEKYKDGGTLDSLFGAIPNSISLFDVKEPRGNHVGYDGIPSNRQIVALIDYCNQNNLIPEDLIAFHAQYSKRAAKKLKSAKETIPAESKHLNWRENFKNRKTGQNET